MGKGKAKAKAVPNAAAAEPAAAAPAEAEAPPAEEEAPPAAGTVTPPADAVEIWDGRVFCSSCKQYSPFQRLALLHLGRCRRRG